MSFIQEITPEPDSFTTYIKKIWRYRALIWVFAKRDIKVKYAQTWLGIGWSLLQPLTAMVVFSFFFSYVLKWKTGDIPFPLYVLSGLLGWNFFSYIVHAGSSSIQESSSLIKRIYFPKSILPLSKVIVALTELVISLFILIPLLVYFNIGISWKVIFVPLVLLFNAICGLSLVFWVAAFAYRKRDLFHLLPFVVYFGIWVTPIFFEVSILPKQVQGLVKLNPMTTVVELWRWVFFQHTTLDLNSLISFVLVLGWCLLGMHFYNRREDQFGDYV